MDGLAAARVCFQGDSLKTLALIAYVIHRLITHSGCYHEQIDD